MHIEHNQFLELVAEAAGLDAEKAEQQLAELIAEIKQSLKEDEAYEIEGFGIFSSLGNRVMFIPSKELETEVNFKYVGMEPIELDEPTPTEEDPFSNLDATSNDDNSKSLDSRFAGLIDEDISDPLLEPGENPGPEAWGVESHKEDKSADRLFASLMGQDYEEPLEEEEGIDTSDATEEEDFSNIFEDSDSDEGNIDLGSEVAAFMTDEGAAEEENTDDLLDQIFAEDEDEEIFDIGDAQDELESDLADSSLETSDDEQESAPILEMDMPVLDTTESDQDNSDEQENEFEQALEGKDFLDELEDGDVPELESEETFDDPFMDMGESEIDESVLRMEEFDDTEIIPVIKNITSDVPEDGKKAKKEEAKKEKEKKKKEKPKKEPKDKAPAPAWLWIVLLLVIVGGSVVGLGYFSILNIPFITPQTASNVTPPPPAQNSTTQQEAPPQEVASTQPNEQQTTDQEQALGEAVQESQTQAQIVNNQVSASADKYGLTGSLSADGNDGYTIILYTLSNQQNAINERQKLLNAGYRGFLTPVASERYGTLFRVSVGQFGTLFDAAVAAEEIEDLLPENYIIKKIN